MRPLRLLDGAGARVAEPGEPSASHGQMMLRLHKVGKKFGDVHAIDDVSFDVRRGEIIGLIGRSGAGKSTLIRCLNGLEKPDEGRIEILGEDIVPLGEGDLRRVRGRMGMIFQHFNLLSAKTVGENVALPLKIARWPKRARLERVEALLELVGLEDKAAAYPAQLSGGQKQRVGIARALAAEPAILLSDEATSALDPETTSSILDLLRDVNRKLGLTIVLITHEMSVIRDIAHRVIVLDRGRIVEEGEVAAVFAGPRADATKRMLESGRSSPQTAYGDSADREAYVTASGFRGAALRGALFRITLEGPLAGRPLLSDLTLATGVRPIILWAKATQAGVQACTTILFEIEGSDPNLIGRVERYLLRAGATVERQLNA